MDDYTLLHGDCLEEMAAMDAGSVDAVVTDPPYGLHFMGKTWDSFGGPLGVDHKTTTERSGSMHAGRYDHRRDGEFQDFMFAAATECMRVLKPSSYLLMTGGTRTWHRLACAIEDAGFEIRDTLMWLYGSGFPKGKANLKPAFEPIILARKPGPMRELVIEECRVAGTPEATRFDPAKHNHSGWRMDATGAEVAANASPAGRWPANLVLECTCDETREGTVTSSDRPGHEGRVSTAAIFNPTPHMHSSAQHGGPNGKEPVRIHTDPNCPCAMLDGQTGTKTSGSRAEGVRKGLGFHGADGDGGPAIVGDSGGASRFFYQVRSDGQPDTSDGVCGSVCDGEGNRAPDSEVLPEPLSDVTRFRYVPKASRSERNAGLDGMEERKSSKLGDGIRSSVGREREGTTSSDDRRAANHHPTVKPLALMRWLVKLVARPGDVVLDPFMGSGTTGVACVMEGREFIGIEREGEYLEIARRRIEHASAQGMLPLDESPPLPPVAGRPT